MARRDRDPLRSVNRKGDQVRVYRAARLKPPAHLALYYDEVSNGEDAIQFAPTHYVDLTGTEPRKRQACFAHASQSPERFYALQVQVTRLRGIERACRHAEGY